MILAKAAELSTQPSKEDDPQRELSLAEMKAIASEAGLDPELIERAAHLLPGVRGSVPMGRIFGGPLSAQVDLYVPVLLSHEAAQRLLSIVRATLMTQGRGEVAGATMSFSSWESGRKVFISAHPDGDGTRLRIVVDNRSRLVRPIIIGLAGLITLNLALPAAVEVGTPWAPYVALGGGTAIIAGLMWRSIRKSVQRTLVALDNLVDALRSFVRDEGAS
jgi:hypothetical protein